MVASNRMAPAMRSPVNTGLVTMRVRILWTRSIIACSPEYVFSSMPYSFSAFGVLPPLWSSAAMKPGWLRILAACCSEILIELAPSGLAGYIKESGMLRGAPGGGNGSLFGHKPARNVFPDNGLQQPATAARLP